MKYTYIAIFFLSLFACKRNTKDPSAIGDEAFSILQKLDSENSEIIKNHIPELQDFRKAGEDEDFITNEVDKNSYLSFSLESYEAYLKSASKDLNDIYTEGIDNKISWNAIKKKDFTYKFNEGSYSFSGLLVFTFEEKEFTVNVNGIKLLNGWNLARIENIKINRK